MNITYTYKITAMKMAPSLDGLTDVVTNVQFEYTGTDSNSSESGTFNGAIPIGNPNPDQSIYNMDHPNEVILKQINEKITPTDNDAPMAWAPPEPTPPPAE